MRVRDIVGLCTFFRESGYLGGGGGGASSSVKRGISRTQIFDTLELTLLDKGGGGGHTGHWNYCEKCACVACGWTSGWPWAMNCKTSNGLNGKTWCRTCRSPERQKCKFYRAAKNGDALERKMFAICESDMHWNGNLGVKIRASPAAHYT